MGKYDSTYYDAQRSFAPKVARPLLCVLALFYLGFHAFSGERGLLALFTESRRLETLQAELAVVKAQRADLEQNIRLMSNSSLDLDMLDEQVRRVLGLTGKNEVVYFLDDTSGK